MTALTEWLLTALLNYGNLLLGGTLFFAAAGIPLPATVLLVAAGAFSQQGYLAWEGAALSAFAGAVAGDGCSYLIGRYASVRLPKWLRQGEGGVQSTKLFERWGVWSIFLTRFLLTPIALPVNLLAGSTRFSGRKYMTAVITGELIWVALFGGLGRVFADHWEMVSQLAGDITGILLGGLLTAGGLAAVVMRNQRIKKGAPSHDLNTIKSNNTTQV